MSLGQFVVVSFYTENTPYETEVRRLIDSLKVFKVPFYMEPVKNLGSWVKNCNYKSEFCKKMLQTYNMSIVWLDCDAEVLKYPSLFNELDDYDMAVATSHKLSNPTEILSGTLFFNNTPGAITLLDKWIEECKLNPVKWDQKNLQKVLGDCANQIKVFDLPPGYAKIFDNSRIPEEDAVIVHWQASRKYKRMVEC